MTTANTFSFKTKDGYNNGNVLKIYYSTNYIPGNQIATASRGHLRFDGSPTKDYNTTGIMVFAAWAISLLILTQL